MAKLVIEIPLSNGFDAAKLGQGTQKIVLSFIKETLKKLPIQNVFESIEKVECKVVL